MPTYKNEKTNTWYCSFYYTEWNGTRKKKKKSGFKTQREAKVYENEFLAMRQLDCSISFGTLTKLYIEDCTTRLKPTTVRNRVYMIDKNILPFFGHMAVCDIGAVHVREWQNQLLRYRNDRGKGYSPTYLKQLNARLSAIFNYGIKYYNLGANPVLKCGAFGRTKSERMEFWTLDEFNAFLPFISNNNASAMMFEILFYSGIRVGELLALTLNDFDFDNKNVAINKTYARLNRSDIIQAPKTKKSNRVVALPDFILEHLRTYVKQIYNYQPTMRLFPVTTQSLYREMLRGCKLSGVKRIRIHDLRHSHASLLINLGCDILLVSERLGHENVQTTLGIYSHLYPDKQNEVVEKLNSLLP